MLATDPETFQIDSDDIKSQTRKVMENIGKLLQDNNLSWQDLIRLRILPLTLSDLDSIFDVLREFLGADFTTWPPTTYMSLVGLPRPQALIEIECEVASIKQ